MSTFDVIRIFLKKIRWFWIFLWDYRGSDVFITEYPQKHEGSSKFSIHVKFWIKFAIRINSNNKPIANWNRNCKSTTYICLIKGMIFANTGLVSILFPWLLVHSHLDLTKCCANIKRIMKLKLFLGVVCVLFVLATFVSCESNDDVEAENAPTIIEPPRVPTRDNLCKKGQIFVHGKCRTRNF